MSRSLADLLPEVKEKAEQLQAVARQAGLPTLVIQTYRTYHEQDDLWAQGRTNPGHKVTWAKGGESWHNFRRAFDIVPLMPNGKLWWAAPDEVWHELGQLGKNIGLEWGGDFPQGKTDLDHFQLTGGMTLAHARDLYQRTGGSMKETQ